MARGSLFLKTGATYELVCFFSTLEKSLLRVDLTCASTAHKTLLVKVLTIKKKARLIRNYRFLTSCTEFGLFDCVTFDTEWILLLIGVN